MTAVEAQRKNRRDMGGRATVGTLSAVECRVSVVVNVGQDELGRGRAEEGGVVILFRKVAGP